MAADFRRVGLMTKLVIFGSTLIAKLACRYFETDSAFEVVAFTVDREFIDSNVFCDRPVVAFEDVAALFPPDDHHMFIGLGYSQLNALRRQKLIEAKAKSYPIASYVSSRATILNEGSVGENCFIQEGVIVQPFVEIGSNVTIWGNSLIGHEAQIADHCFISSNVVVSGNSRIGEQCFLGVGSMIRDNITIGEKCVIGAGALILSDAESGGVYMGRGAERSRVPSHRLPRI